MVPFRAALLGRPFSGDRRVLCVVRQEPLAACLLRTRMWPVRARSWFRFGTRGLRPPPVSVSAGGELRTPREAPWEQNVSFVTGLACVLPTQTSRWLGRVLTGGRTSPACPVHAAGRGVGAAAWPRGAARGTVCVPQVTARVSGSAASAAKLAPHKKSESSLQGERN